MYTNKLEMGHTLIFIQQFKHFFPRIIFYIYINSFFKFLFEYFLINIYF